MESTVREFKKRCEKEVKKAKKESREVAKKLPRYRSGNKPGRPLLLVELDAKVQSFIKSSFQPWFSHHPRGRNESSKSLNQTKPWLDSRPWPRIVVMGSKLVPENGLCPPKTHYNQSRYPRCGKKRNRVCEYVTKELKKIENHSINTQFDCHKFWSNTSQDCSVF